MRLRWVAYIAAALVALGGSVFIAFKLSPWPTVLLVRHAFDKDAVNRNEALAKHVPPGIAELLDQPYGETDREKLDIFRREDAAGPQPTIVWIHGGAFIAGNKRDVSPYLKILASHGYTAVGVGYSLAPGVTYPTPTVQANAALAWLVANAGRLNIDPTRVFLAGDSAGAQIAAQLSAGIADPAYAQAVGFTPALPLAGLKGVVLMCGVFSMAGIDMDGDFGGFIRTVLWSYLGKREFEGDPKLAQFSVDKHVTDVFPPSFVSVGNGDPLAPQSVLIADAIEAKGVAVDRLFFAPDDAARLPHEYQFNLDQTAGRLALDRLLAFLSKHSD